MQIMTCRFSQAARKFGGKMKWSTSGRAPASPNDTKREGAVPVFSPVERTGAGDGGASQASPTARECAQILPHSRDSRQVQTFSISLALRIRSPAR